MTSPAPVRCRPAAPPVPRPAPAALLRRRIQPRDQDLRRPRPTVSPPPARRPCRQTSLTTRRRQEDLTTGHHHRREPHVWLPCPALRAVGQRPPRPPDGPYWPSDRMFV